MHDPALLGERTGDAATELGAVARRNYGTIL
jgi:hypothetical protein